jgi:sec-independent protein translocase protein TatA
MNIPHILAGFGPLGTPELLIIAVLVLVLFGAKKLPTFARSLGKSMGEFKKAREEFERYKSTAWYAARHRVLSLKTTYKNLEEESYDV